MTKEANLRALKKEIECALKEANGKAARLILKAWDKNYNRIPDFIVIEGPMAGGHLGFKKEDILSGNVQSTDEILPDVLVELAPYEKKYGREIPVFVQAGYLTDMIWQDSSQVVQRAFRLPHDSLQHMSVMQAMHISR